MKDKKLEEILKHPMFCIVPFMVLNTRPNGTVKTCSQCHDLRAVHKNYNEKSIQTDLPLDGFQPDYLSFKKDSLEDIWNSDFLKEFRMKKINGEFVKSCKTCYIEDQAGDNISKRSKFNKLYGEEHINRIQDAIDNEGKLGEPPSWWECRLSSECNSACRICNALTSSLIRKQNEKHLDKIPSYDKSITIQATNFYKKWGYLGDSENFKKEFWKNIDSIKYIEFHGGEPLIDKNLLDIFEKLAISGHSKNIWLNGYTNANVCSEEVIELLNCFKGGRVGISIDGYAEENDYLRWPSKWNTVEKNLKNFKILGNTWENYVISAVSTYQCLSIDKLVTWHNNLIQQEGMDIFPLTLNVVTRPSRISAYLIPLDKRIELTTFINDYIAKSFACNKSNYAERNKHTMKKFMALILKDDNSLTQKDLDDFIEYTKSLDKIRKQSVLEIFPKLKFLFENDDEK